MDLYKPFKSKAKNKKFSVKVLKDGKIKTLHFGDTRYKDFTQHGDEKKRKAHLARAKAIKNKEGKLTYKDKSSPNYYSVKYLWKG